MRTVLISGRGGMRRQARQDTREARIISLLAVLALAVSCLLPAAVAEEKQIKIVTTIFPIYDWTREVIGENAQAQLTLLCHACIIPDATACCAQGIEFIWGGKHQWPDDYPEEGTDIVVTGRLEIYLEDGYQFLHLVDSELLWEETANP